MEGVDVLSHDAQFTEAELNLFRPLRTRHRRGDGRHRREGRRGPALLFHDSPARTDDELNRILDLVGVIYLLPILVAREGMRISVVVIPLHGVRSGA